MSSLPNVHESDGVVVYRASAAARCLRMLVALRLGYESMPAGEAMQKVFDRGHRGEPVVLNTLTERHGWVFSRQQETVEVSVSSKVVIRGHIDAVWTSPTSQRVVEVKTMTADKFRQWESQRFAAFPGYADQLTIYMHAMDLPAVYAIGVVDENGDVESVFDFHIDTPPSDIDDIRARVMQAESIARSGVLPSCTSTDFPCPVYYLCDHSDAGGADIRTTDPAIDALATTVDEFRTLRMKYEAAEKGARRTLEEALGDRDKVKTDTWSVSILHPERKTFDKDKAREDGVDVDRYMRVSTSTQLRVTRRPAAAPTPAPLPVSPDDEDDDGTSPGTIRRRPSDSRTDGRTGPAVD